MGTQSEDPRPRTPRGHPYNDSKKETLDEHVHSKDEAGLEDDFQRQ